MCFTLPPDLINLLWGTTDCPPKIIWYPCNLAQKQPYLRPRYILKYPISSMKSAKHFALSSATNPDGVSLLTGQCWRKASTLPRIKGSMTTPQGWSLKNAPIHICGPLKDQPYGVAKRRTPLNRVKALCTLTLLYQKTKPKGLFACIFPVHPYKLATEYG